MENDNKNNPTSRIISSSIFPDIWGDDNATANDKGNASGNGGGEKTLTTSTKRNDCKKDTISKQSYSTFNDDDDDEGRRDSTTSTGEVFHECEVDYSHSHDENIKKMETKEAKKHRVADLTFSPKKYDENETTPALQFAEKNETSSLFTKNIFSPLENAMNKMKLVLSSPSSVYDDENSDENSDDEEEEDVDNEIQNHDHVQYQEYDVKINSHVEEGRRAALQRQHSELSFLSAKSDHDYDEDENASYEHSPLLPQQQTQQQQKQPLTPQRRRSSNSLRIRTASGKSPRRRSSHNSRKHTRKKPPPKKQNFLLKDTDVQDDIHNHNNPWSNKMIILEELGTASSWFILLLPYIAFVVAIGLDWDYSAGSSSDLIQNGWWTNGGGNTGNKRGGGGGLADVIIGPLSGSSSCFDDNDGSTVFPFMPTPSHPCSYLYQLASKNNAEAAADKNITDNYGVFGTAFTSGLITSIPPSMSTYLFGDASFTNVSNDLVSFVSEGKVTTSIVLFQSSISFEKRRQLQRNQEGSNSASFSSSFLRRRNTDKNKSLYQDVIHNNTKANQEDPTKMNQEDKSQEWIPIFISKPTRLDMVCRRHAKFPKADEDAKHKNQEEGNAIWNCNTPRLIDILFSLPNTGVLTGGDLRIDVLFSYHNDENDGEQEGEKNSTFFSPFMFQPKNSKKGPIIPSSSDDQEEILQNVSKIVKTSSFYIQHESSTYATVEICIRLTTLVISFVFLCFWMWSMKSGLGSWSGGGNGSWSSFIFCFGCRKNEHEKTIQWWESPWILFPERRYLLLLLICLLFLQNPVLIISYFYPKLFSDAKIHVAADSFVGIGVHGILFTWLCLMEGLRYHTALIARKRAEHQRKALELRHAAHFVSRGQSNDTDTRLTLYTSTYYDQYGDVDGSADIRNKLLYHDPCGGSAVDFLLPKLLLFVIGISSVIVTAIFRFPASIGVVYDEECSCYSNSASLSPYRLSRYSTIYIASSFTQLLVLLTWLLLILHVTLVTGSKLRKEPFLSTRPAQLAFRILVGILSLGIAALLLPFLVELIGLFVRWMGNNDKSEEQHDFVYHTSSGYNGGEESSSSSTKLDVFLQLLVRTGQRFPYSGTAASIQPGEIVYATVTCLVAAYIFLPASSFYQSDSNDLVDDSIKRNTLGGLLSALVEPPDRSQVDVELCTHKKDKRTVVTLARYTHTWRIFPLPMERQGVIKNPPKMSPLVSLDTFQLSTADNYQRKHSSKYGRGMIYTGRYMPVFCIELACWLLECSWQAYYSPEYSIIDSARMNLDSVGLKMEGYFCDVKTDTHVYVSSNVSQQVDGEEDSIIVVSFRGSTSYENLKTDLSMHQVALPETFTRDDPIFHIRNDDVELGEDDNLEPSLSPSKLPNQDAEDEGQRRVSEESPLLGLPKVSRGARNILRAIPVARQALPCIHAGFHEAYFSVRDQLMESIVNLYRRQFDKAIARSCETSKDDPPGNEMPSLVLPKIYITGHSLGGCLSQLIALDLATNCEIILKQSSPSLTLSGDSKKRKTFFGLFDVSSNDDELEDKAIIDDTNVDEGDASSHGLSDSTYRRKTVAFPPADRKSEGDESSSPRKMLVDFFSPNNETKAQRKNEFIRLQLPIAVYTYGSPRVGNPTFARFYKQRVPHTFRVVNEGDALTALPIPLVCGGNYKHAGLNVLLDEGCTGNTLIGPTIVETLFRFSKVRTSVAAHMMDKYRECLESALTQDELQEYYIGHGGESSNGPGNKNYLPEWVTKRSLMS